MYRHSMDAGELLRLARVLSAVAQRATWDASDPEMTQGEIAVLRDVLAHPNSSVTAVTKRTGFTQSHISASIGRLRAKGHVEVSVDPADARSNLVRVNDMVSRAALRRARRSVNKVLRESLTGLSKPEIDELLSLLVRLDQLVKAGMPAEGLARP